MTGVAVDARGDMVGLELESENIAFRDPQDGMVLETNHWQHPELQDPARKADPGFWRSSYYYNSQNRVQYLEYQRDVVKGVRTLEEFIEFSFDVHSPGRILQSKEASIGNWSTSRAIFMTSRDRRMRVCSHPLDRGRWDEVRCPG